MAVGGPTARYKPECRVLTVDSQSSDAVSKKTMLVCVSIGTFRVHINMMSRLLLKWKERTELHEPSVVVDFSNTRHAFAYYWVSELV